jgi:hypothetical protein
MSETRDVSKREEAVGVETRAWYAGLRRRGQELLSAAQLAPGRPLPDVIPARPRPAQEPELEAQPAW